MTLYLDTSALVKLYVTETDSEVVMIAVQSEAIVIICNVGYPEARSAMARMRNEQRLTHDEHRQAVTDLNHDWSTFVRVDVVNPLPRIAGDLAEMYMLRGYDSVHLAAALYARETVGHLNFLGFDDRLNAAAVEAGLRLYGEEPAARP